MRYFLQISYDGTAYRGWQKQSGVLSIQEILENSISRVLGENIIVVGCGRTDAKVHATQYFLHFDTNKNWDFDLVKRLNQNLPSDISIFEIVQVNDSAHARFDVIDRTYQYYIHTEKNPFFVNRSFFLQQHTFDLDKMKGAVNLLHKYSDYLSFCKTPENNRTTICEVSNAALFSSESGKQIKFEITANRFLRGMVRVIVQRIIEVGVGELSVEDFEKFLQEPNPPDIKSIASPVGLYLSQVRYPFFSNEPYISPLPYFKQKLTNC